MDFDRFGVMLDCSRNAVMTVPELKKFMTVLSRMGYNQLQLYMEDTYEADNELYFGQFRGRYTKQELKELDDFAYVVLRRVCCTRYHRHGGCKSDV